MDGQVREQYDAMPLSGGFARLDFMDALMFDPWGYGRSVGEAGKRDKPHLTAAFGSGGLVTFLVYEFTTRSGRCMSPASGGSTSERRWAPHHVAVDVMARAHPPGSVSRQLRLRSAFELRHKSVPGQPVHTVD